MSDGQLAIVGVGSMPSGCGDGWRTSPRQEILEGRPGKKIILSRIGAYHGLHAYGSSVVGLPYNRDGYGTSSLVQHLGEHVAA